MTLLYGHQFNKLALYHHVKMCLFQTNWKQGTVHRISLHPQLSTLVYREYVVRREQQGEVRRELYFQFFTLNSMIQRNLVFIKKKGKQSFKSLFSVDDEPPTMTMCPAVFSSQLSHSMTTLLFARPVFIASVLQIPKLKTRK